MRFHLYRFFFVLFTVIFGANGFSQIVRKENLTKSQSIYWDFNNTKIQSFGAYYKDDLGVTNLKHGPWKYYDKGGVLVESRTYYKDKLHGQVKLFYSNEKPKQEGYFKMDVQDSIYRLWNESGKLTTEGYYKNGELNGIWKSYYDDGRAQKTEEFIDSSVRVIDFWLPDPAHTQTVINGTGEITTYFTTGTVKEWYNYKNGVYDGAFLENSIYGYPLLEGSYSDGKKSSEWKYYYYTGDIEKISNYQNDKLEGKYTYFYDNGKVNVEGYYQNGLKERTWTWYTNTGSRDMSGTFKNDKQDGDWTYWYPSGQVSYTAKYANDLKTGTWSYFYKDGSKFKVGSFANDEKHGLWETWYENGTLLMHGNYANGKEEGLWSNYWENGELKNETTFKRGVLHGEWKSFHKDGVPKLTGFYKNGNKNKEWIDYFPNGKVKDLVTYKVIKKKSALDKKRVTYESVKHGKSISFSAKDFKMTEFGNYKLDQKDGEWIAYYPGAKIPAVISTYKEGKLHGPMKEFDRRGSILSEINYKDGVKHGKFLTFDKKGKVVVEKEFENGMQVVKERKQMQNGGFSPR